MNKRHVLLADDSEKLLSALTIQLEAHGFDVTACADAYMALSHARQRRPDVMVLDIRMPAGDGFSVLERMTKLPELSDIPVIYITGEKSPQLDLKAEQLGACGVIHKPIILSALLKLIDAAIDTHADLSIREPRVFDIPSEIDVADIPGVNI